MIPAARFPWRDAAVLALHAAALVIVGRWAWQQWQRLTADLLCQVRRHQARRDALARATRPRAVR